MNEMSSTSEIKEKVKNAEAGIAEIITTLRSAQSAYADNNKFIADSETLIQQLRATPIDQVDKISQIRDQAILLLQSVEHS